MGRHRWGRAGAAGRVVGAALIVLAIGACGDDGPVTASDDATTTTSTTTAPVIPSAAGGPGTTLGAGFEVADGTVLLGDPIPLGITGTYMGEPVLDDGWTATSIVDGADPVAVVDEYLRQAGAAGLVEQPGRGCRLDVDVTICAGFARSADQAEPRSLSVEVVRGRRHDVVSDHVVVRYSTTDLYWAHGNPGLGGPEVEVPAPEPWPGLPDVGEPLGTAGEVGHDLLVQEGSRLAGPPRLNLDDATGGISAVLEVTGEPREVLQSYLDELEEPAGSVGEPLRVGEAVVTQAFAGGAGGDGFSLTLVERPGRPAWLAIDGSHD